MEFLTAIYFKTDLVSLIISSLALAALLVIVVRHASWIWREIDAIKSVVEVIAIIIAGVWAYEVFIYEEFVKPSIEPPIMVITSHVELNGVVADQYTVTIRTTLKNTGKIKTDLMAYWYDIHAKVISSRQDASKNGYYPGLLRHLNQADDDSLRFGGKSYVYTDSDFLEAGLLADNGWWLEPDEEITMTRVVSIPRKYQLAQVGVYARTAVDQSKACLQWEETDKGKAKYRLQPVTYLNTGDGDMTCQAKPGYEKFSKAKHESLRKRYGISTVISKTEIALIAQ